MRAGLKLNDVSEVDEQSAHVFDGTVATSIHDWPMINNTIHHPHSINLFAAENWIMRGQCNVHWWHKPGGGGGGGGGVRYWTNSLKIRLLWYI